MRAIIGPNGAGKTTMMDVITGKTRPDDGRRVVRRPVDLTSSTRPRSPISASAASSRSRPCSRATPSRTISMLALKARARRVRRRCSATPRRDERAAHRRDPRTSSASAMRATRARRRALARPEAMARDRHAAGAGPEAAAGRRAGRRHDRRRDRARPRSCSRRSPRTHSVVVVEHDMDFVRELGVQGHRAARRLGAGRGLARPGQRRMSASSKSIWGGKTMSRSSYPLLSSTRAVIPAAAKRSAGIHRKAQELYDGSRSCAATRLVRDDGVSPCNVVARSGSMTC